MEFDQLLQLVQTVSQSSLTGFRYDDGHVKLHFKKEVSSSSPTSSSPALGGESDGDDNVQMEAYGQSDQTVDKRKQEEAGGQVVKSLLVGTVYLSPEENGDPYVNVGSRVEKGQVLAIVEAMKLMNEIESEYEGTVTEVFVENGETVEYGQPLFRIG